MRPRVFFIAMLAVLGLSIVASAAIYYFVQSDLQNNIADIKEKTAELDVIDDKARLLNDTRTELNQLTSNDIEEKLATILPEEKSQAEAIKTLYSIFSQNGIELQGITFDTTQEEPDGTSQSIETDVNGVLSLPVELTFHPEMSYQKAKSLITDIQQSSRHISISQLQITPTTDEGNNNVNVSLSVDIHFEGQDSVGTSEQSHEDILRQIEAGNQ